MCEEYQLSFFFILLLLTQRDQASQGLAIPASSAVASRTGGTLTTESSTASALPSMLPSLLPNNPPQEDEDKLRGSVTALIVIDVILLAFLLYFFIFLLHAEERSEPFRFDGGSWRLDERSWEPFIYMNILPLVVIMLSGMSVPLDSIDCLSAALVFYVLVMPVAVAGEGLPRKYLVYMVFLVLFLTMMGSSLYFIVVWGDTNTRVGAALGMNFVVVVVYAALITYDIWAKGPKGSSDCITPANTSNSEARYGTPTDASLNTTTGTTQTGNPTQPPLTASSVPPPAEQSQSNPTQSLPASPSADGDDAEEEEITVPKCRVCLTKNCKVAFLCGHQTCKGCVGELLVCPICRAPITEKIVLY